MKPFIVVPKGSIVPAGLDVPLSDDVTFLEKLWANKGCVIMLDQAKLVSELDELGLTVNTQARDPVFATGADAQLHLEYRRLMRIAFYEGLGRKPPSSPSHLPSYVRATKKKWGLTFNNSARRLLANIEGFRTWEEAVSAV